MASILAEITHRIDIVPESVERKRLSLAKELFDKYRSGNPSNGVILIPGDKLKYLRPNLPNDRSILSKIRRLFGK